MRVVASYVLEAVAILLASAIVFGVTCGAWWSLAGIPVALYLGFVSFMIGGSKR